jgi:hypothetical protein
VRDARSRTNRRSNVTIASAVAAGIAITLIIVFAIQVLKAASSPRLSRSGPVISETPRSADQFVDSVGINTHFFFSDTPYGTNYPEVAAKLLSLHVRHIRDAATYDPSKPIYYQHLASLAPSGIHADIITDLNETDGDVKSTISLAAGSVESIEYPNEYDNDRDKNWKRDILVYGKTLYSAKADMGDLPIIGPSFVQMRSYSQTFSKKAFASIADFGNIHDYFWTYNPDSTGWGAEFLHCGTWATINFWKGCASYIEPEPIVATETGWDDGASFEKHAGLVSAAIKARYEMRVLLAHWNAGIVRTYLYSLIDTNHENFGLLTSSLELKPSYIAIQSLLADLDDPGPSPTLIPLAYSMSAARSVYHTLLQKRDGSYHLLIWNGVLAVDPRVPTEPVTLTFETQPSSVTKHDWQDDGTVQTTTLTPSAVISMPVTDRVTELVVK